MSVLPTDCYDNIIGLSRTECDCYEDPAPYNYSASGIFLDELEPLKKLNGLLNCESGLDLWLMLHRARQEAILQFIGDANAMLLKYNRLKRQPFYGAIGRVKYTKNQVCTVGTHYGVRLYCADIVSGEMEIKKIGGLFAQTGNLDILIYNNLNELIDTVTIATTAGQHTLTTVNLKLPMHSKYVDNLEYFFVYQYAGNSPKNNDLHCGCGGTKFYFNTMKPYFHTQTKQTDGWAKWVMAGAYSGGVADFSDVTTTTSNNMYGLTLEVNFTCKVGETWCKDYLDFQANPLAAAMAFAIRYKAGEILIDRIMRSTNINRMVLMDAEQNQRDKEMFAAKYNEMMVYLTDNVDVTTTDCFSCKDIISATKMGIFA